MKTPNPPWRTSIPFRGERRETHSDPTGLRYPSEGVRTLGTIARSTNGNGPGGDLHVERADSSQASDWDQIAEASPYATSSNTWAWLEVVSGALRLGRVALIARLDGIPVASFSAFHEKSPRSRIFWSPIEVTWDYGGPCAVAGTRDVVVDALLSRMEDAARSRRASRIMVSPRWDFPHGPLLLRRGYELRPRRTLLRSLDTSEDVLWGSIRKKWRQYARSAEAKGVVVRDAKTPAEVEQIHRFVASTLSDRTALVPPLALFRGVFERMMPLGFARLRIAIADGETVAGDLLFQFNGAVSERFRGSNERGRELHANHLLVWRALQESREMNYLRYDFGGIADDSVGEGIRFFKEGFGGQPAQIPWFRKDLGILALVRRARERLRPREGGSR